MKIYIVQINMSDCTDCPLWENADFAFKTREQADADIEFKATEYGIKSEDLRIVELELV